jgi:cobalt-precorrin-7 (C5)-methyltransferase
MAVRRRPITIVGCGPGSRDYLTLAALKAVEQADVLVGAKRLLELFPDSKAERVELGAQIGSALDEIQAKYFEKRVVVLVTGDPGLYSLAKLVIARFGRDNCAVIPGISSVQSAFAAIGIDWADAAIISAHKEDPKIYKQAPGASKIAILGGRKGFSEWLRDNIPESHRNSRFFLCENLTLEDERVKEVSYSELGTGEISSRAVLVIVPED